ncbi:MAG TPA: beta-ketoacyl-ACP synthase III [Phycisphaerae bacterium]|nr:beta-ketoacyl-ACP synthase III [Phycisphaerae bacterium]HNU44586.1 beta-ketoacyl-ACP synthase III [Phycisphaerae bacterium]
MSQRIPLCVRGTGSFVPARVLTNDHFIRYLDTSEEWILARTGIRERRWVGAEECTSTMAIEAGRRALEDARMRASEIDLIICATATPDHMFPPTAAYIQDGLGMREIPAFDLEAACSGFIYAMMAAAAFVSAGLYRNILIFGAETLSRVGDPQDRGTCILFGDAAGAAILGPAINSEQGILHWELGCDGSRADYIVMPSGGMRRPASEETVRQREHYLRMRGREVFKFAVGKMEELIDRALAELGMAPDELALVIPHQSNLRIIQSARERLGLPPEKVAVNIDRYGNTSAASVILALDEGRRNGTLKPGDTVLVLGVGAGLTWGLFALRL